MSLSDTVTNSWSYDPPMAVLAVVMPSMACKANTCRKQIRQILHSSAQACIHKTGGELLDTNSQLTLLFSVTRRQRKKKKFPQEKESPQKMSPLPLHHCLSRAQCLLATSIFLACFKSTDTCMGRFKQAVHRHNQLFFFTFCMVKNFGCTRVHSM